MKREDSSDAPFMPLENGLKPVNYPQDFVYSTDYPNKPPEGKIERLNTAG